MAINITIITVVIIIIVHSLAGERMHGLPNVSQEELKEEQHDVREHYHHVDGDADD